MTEEEYAAHVADIAVSFLSEHDAKGWKQKHEDGTFSDFMEEVEYSGGFHAHIDAHCASTWRDAIAILEVSAQNADFVDSGLYEGCDWQRILVIIAFEVLSWDVREKAEELFDGEFEEAVVPLKNTDVQWGFFPSLKEYRIPDGPHIVAARDFIKILLPSRGDSARMNEPQFSVIFEGIPKKRGSYYLVPCRRVYVQHKQNINDAMKRCFEEFGVKEQKTRRKK